jgi:HK97 family phage portal protein
MGVINFLKKKLVESMGGSMVTSALMGTMVSWFGDSKETYLRKGYASNVHVFTAARVYLNKAKVAPYILSKVKNNKQLVKYEQFIQSKDSAHRMEALRIKEQALEEIEDHELLDLLNNPNSYQTASEFREAALGFFKVLGETFIYGVGPIGGKNKGKFKQLHVINPTMIEPVFSGKALDPVAYYRLNIDNQSVRIEKEFICHFKTWNPLDPLSGLSPMRVGRKTLTRNDSNHTAQTKAFQNGGVAHLLSSESDTRPLTQEQMDLINERLIQKIKGAENYQNIQATNGLVKATKIGESPADLGLIESDVHDRGIFASLIGVDPILVGDKKGSSFANQEQAYKALVTNLIMPDLISFAENLSLWLLPKYDEKLHLQFDTTVYSELAPDLEKLVKVYGQPLLTENEKRGVFNWDAVKIKEMDDIYVKSGLIPLSRIAEVNYSQQPKDDPAKPSEDDQPKKSLYSIATKDSENSYSQLIEAASFEDAERIGMTIAKAESKVFISANEFVGYIGD